ncbi:MAG: hypothetical protein WBI41_08745, partial [Azovibrio sp.]|uniref:hypothetical protein n=1 Tax=Azovibrio sp. TaxID=1872673 RepID=UPI003C789FAE
DQDDDQKHRDDERNDREIEGILGKKPTANEAPGNQQQSGNQLHFCILSAARIAGLFLILTATGS